VALTAGFVLAYEKFKPFHNAVGTAFILLRIVGGAVVGGMMVRCAFAASDASFATGYAFYA
jgi:hypothetical protein